MVYVFCEQLEPFVAIVEAICRGAVARNKTADASDTPRHLKVPRYIGVCVSSCGGFAAGRPYVQAFSYGCLLTFELSIEI